MQDATHQRPEVLKHTLGGRFGSRLALLKHPLSTIFGFIGVTDINYVSVENDESGGTGLAASIASARTKIA